MATTFAKVESALREMTRQTAWSPPALIDARKRRDNARRTSIFHLHRGNPPRRTPLSDKSFSVLLAFMEDLGLITKDADGNLRLDPTTQGALSDDDQLRNKIDSAVTSLLNRHDLRLSQIRDACNSIQFPNVRDSATILEALRQKGSANNLDPVHFSKIMYLLACAERRFRRETKVFYTFIGA